MQIQASSAKEQQGQKLRISDIFINLIVAEHVLFGGQHENFLFDGGVQNFLAFLPTFLAMQKVGAQPA